MKEEFPLPLLLGTLRLAKSTFYYHAGREKTDRYADVRPLVREIFGRTKNGCGYRQVRMALRNEQGLAISRKTVNRLMREEGLACRIRRKRYDSSVGPAGKAAGNVLARNFSASSPFEKIATDVTEFAFPWGKAYLSPVMDLYNNEIVAWDVSRSPNLASVDRMLERLFEKLPAGAKPVFHSDQGWQYRQKSYRLRLEKRGVIQSMSRKATCLDNACVEGFFGHLKDEFYRGQKYPDFETFRSEIDSYIRHWNRTRYQECLHGLSPEGFRILGIRRKKRTKAKPRSL